MVRRYRGLILDFAGVLTSSLVEAYDLFEARERVLPGRFLRAWASPEGQGLYRRLELGMISQQDWNEGFSQLLGIPGDNLMRRALQDLMPAYEVLKVAREARSAGVRTAVLSNSLGRDPYDPYAAFDLAKNFDVVVLSDKHGIRKPDPAIFQLTLEQLRVPAESCVFADDTEDNLIPAQRLGMTVIHALDEEETAVRLRELLGLRRRLGSLPGDIEELAYCGEGAVRREPGAQVPDRCRGPGGVHAAEAADGVRGFLHGGIEVVKGEVRLGGTGKVDGVAARVLVVASVVGLDRRVEAADGLCGVAEVESGRSGDHFDLALGDPVQDFGVVWAGGVVQGGAGLVDEAGGCLSLAELGVRAGRTGGEHRCHPLAAECLARRLPAWRTAPPSAVTALAALWTMFREFKALHGPHDARGFRAQAAQAGRAWITYRMS